uniref:Reverse transcriptase domain-containing protein n=1 Tax=Clastoptera arizonana TaxID=38151 RepID=A0A1B6E1G1_9HEMI
MGQAPCDNSNFISNSLSFSLLTTADTDLHKTLQKFWQQEEPPLYSNKSEKVELCERHFMETHYRELDGRYVVKLPFRRDHPPLGASKEIANRRFHALEHKFLTQPHFRDLYCQFMSNYLAEGHMEKVSSVDTSQPHYFIPHHGVLKDNSSTTKLRTVFDASAKTSTGISLNDILLTGRKLQLNVCDIIIQFRMHNIVFTCDIRQMYRQIKLSPEDQTHQLILWRDNSTQKINVYKLSTVTYGISSSPYLAIRTLAQLAQDEGAAFPEAAKILTSQAYVDDIITGSTDEESALQLQEQLIAFLKRGGFELRKWLLNFFKRYQ